MMYSTFGSGSLCKQHVSQITFQKTAFSDLKCIHIGAEQSKFEFTLSVSKLNPSGKATILG